MFDHIPHLRTLHDDVANPYASLTPPEMELLLAIGNRASLIVKDLFKEKRGLDMECNGTLLALDFAIAHLARPINLKSLLEANDLDFMDDFGTVAMHINRPLAFFPADVTLKFTAIGGVYVIGN